VQTPGGGQAVVGEAHGVVVPGAAIHGMGAVTPTMAAIQAGGAILPMGTAIPVGVVILPMVTAILMPLHPRQARQPPVANNSTQTKNPVLGGGVFLFAQALDSISRCW